MVKYKMSKLNRGVIRLNKSKEIMNSIEQTDSDKIPLTTCSFLTDIIRDIPANKLVNMYDKRGLTTEWETIATVARTVSLTKIDMNQVDSIRNHLPCDNDIILKVYQIYIIITWQMITNTVKIDGTLSKSMVRIIT